MTKTKGNKAIWHLQDFYLNEAIFSNVLYSNVKVYINRVENYISTIHDV